MFLPDGPSPTRSARTSASPAFADQGWRSSPAEPGPAEPAEEMTPPAPMPGTAAGARPWEAESAAMSRAPGSCGAVLSPTSLARPGAERDAGSLGAATDATPPTSAGNPSPVSTGASKPPCSKWLRPWE